MKTTLAFMETGGEWGLRVSFEAGAKKRFLAKIRKGQKAMAIPVLVYRPEDGGIELFTAFSLAGAPNPPENRVIAEVLVAIRRLGFWIIEPAVVRAGNIEDIATMEGIGPHWNKQACQAIGELISQ